MKYNVWVISKNRWAQVGGPFKTLDEAVRARLNCVFSTGDLEVREYRDPELPATSPRKDDKQKPRWSLFPANTLMQVLAVLEHGAAKYGPENWHGVVKGPDGRQRYYNAMMRHLESWLNGEVRDIDSKLPAMAHIACSALFLLWDDLRKEKNNE